MNKEKNFAILIDADNISTKYVKNIMDEISNYGVATYKRVYGDLTKKENKNWEKVALENAITPMQQFNYTVGKSSTDSGMIIDAMDILYSGNVDGFCIVSSDSDFTKLVIRLRESGMEVIGMGEQKTVKPFVKACSLFKYLDLIAKNDTEEKMIPVETVNKSQIKQQEVENQKSEIVPKKEILQYIRKLFNESDDATQGLNIGEIGQRLIKAYPDFDVRNYGYNRLSAFLKSFDGFETKESYFYQMEREKTNVPKRATILAAIEEYLATEKDEEGANILQVKKYLEEHFEEFDIADYGYSKLSTFFKDFEGLEMRLTGVSNGVMRVRKK